MRRFAIEKQKQNNNNTIQFCQQSLLVLHEQKREEPSYKTSDIFYLTTHVL